MIRKMVIDDIPQIVSLETDIFGHTLGERYLYNELSENPFAHYYVIKIDQEIIAYIGVHIIDEGCDVINFLVKENRQYQGYGQMLFSYIIDTVITKEVKQVTLDVRLSNDKAIRFYLKNGFKKAYIRSGYYGNEDGIVLMKDVNL